MNKKISFPIAVIIIVVCAVLTGLIVWQYGLISEIGPAPSPIPTREEVTITTDKTEYEQGEIVRITIENNLNKSICLESCNTFLFQKKNGIWKNYLQKQCLVNFIKECINSKEEKIFEETLLKQDFLQGLYRIEIPVYIDCAEKNFPCEQEKTIYSNEFTIKEKFGVSTSKNCDDYEMPMTEEEIRECTCPEGYIKFNRLMGAYCATDSQKPCSAHTDCPKGEHCISQDGKDWYCTGQFAGCYYDDPENPKEQICAD